MLPRMEFWVEDPCLRTTKYFSITSTGARTAAEVQSTPSMARSTPLSCTLFITREVCQTSPRFSTLLMVSQSLDSCSRLTLLTMLLSHLSLMLSSMLLLLTPALHLKTVRSRLISWSEMWLLLEAATSTLTMKDLSPPQHVTRLSCGSTSSSLSRYPRLSSTCSGKHYKHFKLN